MPANGTITLYHAPNTRSSSTLLLLEELGAPYELKLLNFKAGEQRQPAYLAINPMGKVPAIEHNGAVVTEQVAILIYLADLFPEAGLAPALADPLRGPYLRWLVFYAACFEPAIVDKALNREPGRRGDRSIRRFRHHAQDGRRAACEGALASGRALHCC